MAPKLVSVANGLTTSGVSVKSYKHYWKAGVRDVHWLPTLQSIERCVLVTADARIYKDPQERGLLHNAGASALFFVGTFAQKRPADQVALVKRHLPSAILRYLAVGDDDWPLHLKCIPSSGLHELPLAV